MLTGAAAGCWGANRGCCCWRGAGARNLWGCLTGAGAGVAGIALKLANLAGAAGCGLAMTGAGAGACVGAAAIAGAADLSTSVNVLPLAAAASAWELQMSRYPTITYLGSSLIICKKRQVKLQLRLTLMNDWQAEKNYNWRIVSDLFPQLVVIVWTKIPSCIMYILTIILWWPLVSVFRSTSNNKLWVKYVKRKCSKWRSLWNIS